MGLPEDFELRKADSLGMQLISSFAKQLRGTLRIASAPGAEFTIQFPKR